MPYRLPTFNLTCNIHTATLAGFPGWPPVMPARLLAVPCALVFGRRISWGFNTGNGATAATGAMNMHLLLPALTDIRGIQDITTFVDWVDVPAGSGRWYSVAWVDDIGKGYANEHRTALVQAGRFRWTAPYP